MDATTTPEATMFDTLTPSELAELATKLSHAGTALFHSGEAIHRTAMYMQETGRITAGDDAWNGLYNVRAPILDAMHEAHDIMNEVDAHAARTREAGRHAMDTASA
jgi:hypothetical protein